MEPEDKEETVVFLFYDEDTDSYEELHMNKEAYDEMCRAEEEYEKQREEARERDRREERETLRMIWEREDREERERYYKKIDEE